MMSLIERFRSRITNNSSKKDAKRRLQFLLVHDRVNLSPGQMEKLKVELLEVLSRYVEIEPEATEIELRCEATRQMSIVSNVPVKRVLSQAGLEVP